MDDQFEDKVLRFVRKYPVEMLAALYLLPLLWGTLVPFDFGQPSDTNKAAATWFGLPIVTTPLPDAISNVALYMPFGFLILASFRRRGWRIASSFFATMALGATISYAVEYSQLFSQLRMGSRADFTCNVAGTFIGAVSVSIVIFLGEAVWGPGRRTTRRYWVSMRNQPSGTLAQLCAVVLFLASTAPFDVTFSVNHIRQSVKDARLIPFSMESQLSATITPAAIGNDGLLRVRLYHDQWQLSLDYLWTVTGYALLAILICRYLSWHCKVHGLRRAAWTVTACALLAFVGSATRLFIISRTADVTDILLALFGSACGVLLADRAIDLWVHDSRTGRSGVSSGRQRIVFALLAGWCVFIAARQLAPFDPDFSADSIRRQVQSLEWLPMQKYERTRLPIAAGDILMKLVSYGWLGMLLCAWRSHRRIGNNRLSVFKTGLAVGAVVAALECAQILLPPRVPSVTDVLIAMLGTACGVLAYRIEKKRCQDDFSIRLPNALNSS